MEDRFPGGQIIVSVFGTVIYIGSAAEYPVGLAAWCAQYGDVVDYHFTPLHRSAYQDALVLAYRKFRENSEPRLPQR